MIIRNVKKSDLESFIKLYIESYTGLESYAYTSRKDIKEYFSWLLLRDPDGFLIAELNEPVGFVACDANWFSHFEGEVLGEIHELFVHPKYRCSGIGSMLLERATEYARSKGRRIVGLWVGVENFNAKGFYEKRGFVETVSIGKWTRMIKKI
ncbi:MAG: GNAT family N-acetyltransferase [Candidatus Bathyarchaeia archaeon]